MAMVLPLVGADYYSMVQSVMSSFDSISSPFTAVGAGVASLCLLFCVFYFSMTILDGGRFQLKMLWPLVVYILACNPALLTKTVTGFTNSISKNLSSACQTARGNVYGKMGTSNLFQYAIQKAGEQVQTINDAKKALSEETQGEDLNDPKQDGGTTISKIGMGVFTALKAAFKFIFNGVFISIVEVLTGLDRGVIQAFLSNILVLIIGAVFMLIVDILNIAIVAVAAMMIGICVAFAPLTLGFAVFPGMGKLIGGWIVRVIQFSLWGPIVGLVGVFSASIFTGFIDASTSLHVGISTGDLTAAGDAGKRALVLCGFLFANIVVLINVPAAAAYVIEGSGMGGLSLAQGMSAVTKTFAMVATGGSMNIAEAARDKQELQVLQSINRAVGGDPNAGRNGPLQTGDSSGAYGQRSSNSESQV